MSNKTYSYDEKSNNEWIGRIVSILDQARANTVRSINTQMVTAYWLIGREIVLEEQKGDARAEYGKQLIRRLSLHLTDRFGKGFSLASIKLFRQFYLVYQDRNPIQEGSLGVAEIESRNKCNMLEANEKKKATQCVAFSGAPFNSNLGWSHYRVLMRIENKAARQFYEEEAAKNGWSVRQLERQVHSLFFERLLKSSDKAATLADVGADGAQQKPIDIIKDPYVLEFLDLPESHKLSESALENALISSLQNFLLELGGGFAFIGRQKRLTLEGDHFYPDLVFYHTRLKCYVIIDLKTKKLDHADLGQMQLYVNYYDQEIRAPDDNPTVGLLLCTAKNDAVVRYILGEGNQQIFAAKYQMELPTLEELCQELKRERRRVEEGAAAHYGARI